MSELLGEARILIAADTKPFLAQIQELRALASKPIVVPVATAGGVGGATKAQQELAGAMSVTNRVTNAQSKAASDLARHQEQLGRGAATAGLSFLGLRAQVLAASGAFIAGATAAKIVRDSITAASDRTEQLNKSIEVFAGSADAVRKWSETTATAMGISQTAALAASSTYGQLFRTLGVGPDRAAALSESLVKLAGDLASFNNVSVDRALQALQSGLVGQARPLRQLGVFLTAARVQQEAFAETGKKTASQLTQQDTILARYNLILKDSVLAQGDFRRTQDRLANQSRILRAELGDLEANLGKVLVPVIAEDIAAFNQLITVAQKLGDRFGKLQAQPKTKPGGFFSDILGGFAKAAFTPVPVQIEKVITTIKNGMEESAISIDVVSGKVERLFAAFRKEGGGPTALNALILSLQKMSDHFSTIGPKGRAFSEQIDALIARLRDLAGTGAGLPPINLRVALDPQSVAALAPQATSTGKKIGVQILDGLRGALTGQPIFEVGAKMIEDLIKGAQSGATGGAGMGGGQTFVGGGLGVQIAAARAAGNDNLLQQLLEQQNANLRQQIEHLSTFPASPKNQARIAALFNQITSNNNEITGLQSKAGQAAKDAASAREKATQTFLDSFGPRIQALQDKVTAAANKSIEAQIAANNALVVGYKKEIAAIKKRIRDMNLHGQALKIARDAIRAINQSIRDTRREINSEIAQRRQDIIDAQQAHLEALLSIAETTPGTRDDRAALNALIKFDQAQIDRINAIKRRRKLTRDEKAELDSWRVDLAQRNEALRNLNAEQKKNNTAQAEFTFLQTQTGFVSNLLGNLIPLGSTGGLVGGGGAPTTPSNVRQPLTAARTQAQANRTPGVTSGQGETQIYWLKQIAIYLKRLNEGRDHPEAHHQRKVGAAAYDYGYQGPGM